MSQVAVETHSCTWTGKLSDLENHRQTCVFVAEKCPNEGCEEEFIRKYMLKHMSACPHQLFHCHMCNKSIKCAVKEEHERELCDGRVVECRNGCSSKFPFCDRFDHLKVCPLEVIECPFVVSANCAYLGKRSEMNKHAANMKCHFFGLLRKVEELSLQVKELTLRPITFQWSLDATRLRMFDKLATPSFDIAGHKAYLLLERNSSAEFPNFYGLSLVLDETHAAFRITLRFELTLGKEDRRTKGWKSGTGITFPNSECGWYYGSRGIVHESEIDSYLHGMSKLSVSTIIYILR